MRKVISLVGRNAGHEIWMDEPVAEAALSTGAVALPGSDKAISMQRRFGLYDGEEDFDENARREIRFGRADKGVKLIGGWPRQAVIPRRLQESRMFVMRDTGYMILTIGDDKAIYRAVANSPANEIWADLKEIVDGTAEAQAEAGEEKEEKSADTPDDGGVPPPDDATLPANWRSLHWKQKAQLAEGLTGQRVTNGTQATLLLEQYETGENLPASA